jgi:hypothetical protein
MKLETFILDLILASKIDLKYHSFRQQKKSQEKIPDSFSRSVGTAKLKGLQVRFCLYLYFNLFNYSKVSLFSYFGASQWLQDAHKVSELFIVWMMSEFIITNLSEKWSEPDGITNRLKLVCLT